MGWPQYTVIALWALSFVAGLFMHGKPRENFNVAHTCLNIFVTAILLTAGGFWSAMP